MPTRHWSTRSKPRRRRAVGTRDSSPTNSQSRCWESYSSSAPHARCSVSAAPTRSQNDHRPGSGRVRGGPKENGQEGQGRRRQVPRKNHRPARHKGGHSKGRSHSHIKKSAVGRRDLAGAAHGFAARLVARGLGVAQIIDTPRPAATVVARLTRPAKVRADLEASANVESFTTRTDSLGRQQPAQPVPKPPVKEVCRRHPNGDTGEPCGRCANIRRRRQEEQRHG